MGKIFVKTLVSYALIMGSMAANAAFLGRPSPGGNSDQEQIRILQAKLGQIYGEIGTVTADLSCTSDSECHSIAVGNRACGGPQGYMVYSVAKTDVPRLTDLAAQSARVEGEINALTGLASICSMQMPPTVGCVADLCKEVGN